MKKSFFYRVMVLSLGALLAGIIACKNPASPEPVKPDQNVQKPSDNGLGGGGTPNPGEPTPGGGGGGGGSGGGDGPAPTPNPVNPQTDQERVEAAKAVLELRVNENNGKVKYRIYLSSMGAYGTSISWTSSPAGIIKTNAPDVGEVTRPEDDTEVTLTATITKGSATATKTFTVTVYGKNQELVDRAVQQIRPQPPAFVMGNPAPSLSLESSTLIINGPNPATDHISIPLTWKAEPEGIIDVWGGVTQPAEKKTVTLTATARKGNSTGSRTFTVTSFSFCKVSSVPLNFSSFAVSVTFRSARSRLTFLSSYAGSSTLLSDDDHVMSYPFATVLIRGICLSVSAGIVLII